MIVLVDPATLSMIRDVVTIFGVIAGFTYYVLTVQATRKNQEHQLETRQAQLFMQVFDRYNTVENNKNYNMMMNLEWSSFEEYQSKYYLNADEIFRATISKTFGSYEALGVMVEEGFLDPNILAKYISSEVINLWEKYGPIVTEYRKRVDYPNIYNKFEYLYREMKKLRPETPKPEEYNQV